MKKTMLCGIAALLSCAAFAQEDAKNDSVKGFQFTTVDSVAITSVKNQKNAGTCWSYSGLSFLESEALKKTGKVYDFSEMFVIQNTYMDRAEKSVRTHGDVLDVPRSSMSSIASATTASSPTARCQLVPCTVTPSATTANSRP